MRLSSTILFILIITSIGWAQSQIEKFQADEDYYMFPIRPGQTNYLAGNMGELRTSHFHAGLDIRTEGRTGLPVYAAADGYISRISITEAGYGKALYVTHPNGETTVYAHLSKFNNILETYTQKEQYQQQQLHVKLFPNKGEISVSKGDIIAYSGNSGSSGGPHLHFEIRDKDHTILNPLKYNFEEIKDTTPPTLKKLAITPFSVNSRVDGTYQRKEFKLTQHSDIRYSAKDTIMVYGDIGFELFAYDKLNGGNFKCGISEIDFYIDNKTVFYQKIDSINFAEQRNILVHYNYPAYAESGEKYHKMYVDNGNSLRFYSTNRTKGRFKFTENRVYNALVSVTDIYGNKSVLEFVIKCSQNAANPTPQYGHLPSDRVKMLNNVLVIHSESADSTIQVLSDSGDHYLTPQYASSKGMVYLWDLQAGSVSNINFCDTVSTSSQWHQIPSGIEFDYYTEGIKTHFGSRSLFDTLYYSSQYYVDPSLGLEMFRLGNSKATPLRDYVTVTLNPKKKYEPTKTHVYSMQSGTYSYYGGQWEGHQVQFSTRDFGTYTLLTDTIPPLIRPIVVSGSNLKFKITDELSGIESFSVFADNNWVLMDYDYKTQLIWSIDFSSNQKQDTEIIVKVIDKAGNEQIYKTKLKI